MWSNVREAGDQRLGPGLPNSQACLLSLKTNLFLAVLRTGVDKGQSPIRSVVGRLRAWVLSHSVLSDSATCWTAARQAPLSMWLQARTLEQVSVPFSRGSSKPRAQTCCLLQLLHCRRILYRWVTGEAQWVEFSSVTQLCPTLCYPMNCSMPGLSVQHQLPEPTQIHVHWVGDAIQLSHPVVLFSSCLQSFPASGSFPMSQLFTSGGQSMEFQLQHQSFQWTPRTDLLYERLVGSPCSPRGSQESSPASQFKNINSSVFSLLYSPTLTSIHDYWKNHRFD